VRCVVGKLQYDAVADAMDNNPDFLIGRPAPDLKAEIMVEAEKMVRKIEADIIHAVQDLLHDNATSPSLREQSAIAAMQGVMSNPSVTIAHKDHWLNVAMDAVNMADALVAELEKTK
jgi:ribosomal protein RSM22 (predicted rRNA methylase)